MDIKPPNLHVLRTHLKLTLKDVGLATGISPSTLSKYENGTSKPIPENLAALARLFDVSPTFLGADLGSVGDLKYRKFSTRQRKSLSADAAAAQLYAHVINEFEELIFLPEYNLPRVDCPPRVDSTDNERFEDVDRAARLTRELLLGNDEPVFHLFQVIEQAGVVSIIRRREGSSDGWSTWISNRGLLKPRPIITLYTDTPEALTPRERFSLAHELGHLVMHQNVVPSSSEEHKAMEADAFRFASVFLMPTVESSWASLSLSKLLSVKMHYGVSVQAIIRRLRDDGHISQDRYTMLSIDLSRRGWRRTEPFDGEFTQDSPSLLRELHEWAVDERLSPDWLVSKSGLPADIVAAVLSVDPDSLKPRNRFQARFRRDM